MLLWFSATWRINHAQSVSIEDWTYENCDWNQFALRKYAEMQYASIYATLFAAVYGNGKTDINTSYNTASLW